LSERNTMSLQLPKQVPEKGFYYHYKHDPNGSTENYAYEVVSIGSHTESDDRPEYPQDAWFVNYRPLYENAAVYQASKQLGIECIDNRPLEMWMGHAEVGGKSLKRFTKITDPTAVAQLEERKRLDVLLMMSAGLKPGGFFIKIIHIKNRVHRTRLSYDSLIDVSQDGEGESYDHEGPCLSQQPQRYRFVAVLRVQLFFEVKELEPILDQHVYRE
jgi:hypothetical protein